MIWEAFLAEVCPWIASAVGPGLVLALTARLLRGYLDFDSTRFAPSNFLFWESVANSTGSMQLLWLAIFLVS